MINPAFLTPDGFAFPVSPATLAGFTLAGFAWLPRGEPVNRVVFAGEVVTRAEFAGTVVTRGVFAGPVVTRRDFTGAT